MIRIFKVFIFTMTEISWFENNKYMKIYPLLLILTMLEWEKPIQLESPLLKLQYFVYIDVHNLNNHCCSCNTSYQCTLPKKSNEQSKYETKTFKEIQITNQVSMGYIFYIDVVVVSESNKQSKYETKTFKEIQITNQVSIGYIFYTT